MSERAVSDLVAAEIRSGGPIPFPRYMELCLYTPGLGYYQREAEVTGREGDFVTAPHVSALFGSTLARWLGLRLAEMGLSAPTLLELGPGNGLLASDILGSWEGPQPPMLLAEAGAARRRALEERFRGRDVRILDPAGLETVAPFEGAAVANEFFDALPVRVFQRRGGEILEMFVGLQGGGLTEVLSPVDESKLDPAFRECLGMLPDGHRAEYPPDGRLWMERASSLLLRGLFVVIDYGDVFEMLTAPWRARGTLRCFSGHDVDGDPLSRPGEKDLTASVNFDLLRAWATGAGFEVEKYTTQSSFLIRAGILENLQEMQEPGSRSQESGDRTGAPTQASLRAVQTLIHDETGMGEAFKVLVLRK